MTADEKVTGSGSVPQMKTFIKTKPLQKCGPTLRGVCGLTCVRKTTEGGFHHSSAVKLMRSFSGRRDVDVVFRPVVCVHGSRFCELFGFILKLNVPYFLLKDVRHVLVPV